MRAIVSLILTLLFFSPLPAIVTDSIVPFLEGLENGSKVIQDRYSTSQYQEIVSTLKRTKNKFRVVSYNILMNISDREVAPEYRWESRFPRLIEYLDVLQPDILCVQEPQVTQIDQLLAKIGDKYAFYFDQDVEKTIRDRDGIFYRKDRFAFIEGKTSTVPHEKYTTAITMARLRDKRTSKEVRVWNCHFPWYSANAREKVTNAVVDLIKPYAAKEAAILTGDLNTMPNRPDLTIPFLDGYKIMFSLTQSGIEDSLRISLLGHIGPISSFTNAPPSTEAFKGTGEPGIILDHIMVSSSLTVLGHGIDPGKVDGYFCSDHMPVIADLIQK